MKSLHLLSTLFASLVASRALPSDTAAQELFTIETGPGEIREVTEEERWALKRQGITFFDITESGPSLPIHAASTFNAAVYPTDMTQSATVKSLASTLNKANMNSTLTTFSSFYNRYYRSSYGNQSSTWLQAQVSELLAKSGVDKSANASVAAFPHSWIQSSVIARIPGKSSSVVVVGAHQDSINQDNPTTGKAPGADDNGSGSMIILEAFRVLLADPVIAKGQAENTIEFHWYAGEEAGELGSQAVFKKYSADKVNVRAMLNQDMAGYVKPGGKEQFGVFSDSTDKALTGFVQKVITAYCSIPWVPSRCGYACSDQASATKYGYQSAFVAESTYEDSFQLLHTPQDDMSNINFNHMAEHGKLIIGFVYELAMTKGL